MPLRIEGGSALISSHLLLLESFIIQAFYSIKIAQMDARMYRPSFSTPSTYHQWKYGSHGWIFNRVSPARNLFALKNNFHRETN